MYFSKKYTAEKDTIVLNLVSSTTRRRLPGSVGARKPGPHAARRLLVAAGALLAAAYLALPAAADTGMLIGVDDDGPKWDGSQTLAVARDLGLTALRITVPWQWGQSLLSDADRGPLDEAILGASGIRIVVAVYLCLCGSVVAQAKRSGAAGWIAAAALLQTRDRASNALAMIDRAAEAGASPELVTRFRQSLATR